jgi:plastocyanin
MNKRWIALLLACLTLLVVAAGCGDDDDDGGGGGGGGGATTEEQAAPEASGGSTEVSMKDIKFDPAEVSVNVGDTVTWVNDDSVGHDVTADGFKSGEPGAMQNGDTFEHTFDKAGTFDYVCSVHPGMDGSVTVK